MRRLGLRLVLEAFEEVVDCSPRLLERCKCLCPRLGIFRLATELVQLKMWESASTCRKRAFPRR